MDYKMNREDWLIAIIIILLIIAVIFSVIAFSPRVISEDRVEVEAIITEVDKDPMRWIGKTYMPADYDIYFEYQDIKGEKDISVSEYDEYKDKVGQVIRCYLITRTYDNGSTKVTLEIIEE